ncbi:ArsR/SmtB family transcription factor [Actinocrispum wychmicini]|uniref:HTH arsR-type domain-containing protein n=1 Tax=Actinocrispum wychmicini TaxID=1213861 RepID=A0A4V2S5J2_9PSEU|nr:DUF5937 family protein [Actinocrispum wychmicini]TCO52350.1 hypothetical protein EV192_11281 [Actinocrispum wychmicini]
MGLVIHFTGEDLAKTTFATAPDPFWEILLSLHALQDRSGPPAIRTWRTDVTVDQTVRRLLAVAPNKGYSPDFLTPAEGAEGFAAGLDALRRTPAARRHSEVARLTGTRRMPAWLRRVVADPPAFEEFTTAWAGYHRTAICPQWIKIEAGFRRDRAQRARHIVDNGIEGALTTISPWMRWSDMTLEVAGEHVTGNLHLSGRGLRLIPSYFCTGAPTLLADPTLPPVLVYPVAHNDEHPQGGLSALLGATRARILMAAAQGCTTTELGTVAECSPASASYHASVLRAAGLILTWRNGGAVQHSLTPLGENLLAGAAT